MLSSVLRSKQAVRVNVEIMRMPGPEGKLGHAEVKIGDARVMLSDEYEAMGFLGPQARGGGNGEGGRGVTA